MANLIATPSASVRDNLLAHDHPPVIVPITIAAGEGVLVRGEVLGKLDAGGYGKYLDGEVDGTGTAAAVLWTPEGVDATTEEVKCHAVIHAGLRKSALTGIDDNGIADLWAVGLWVLDV